MNSFQKLSVFHSKTLSNKLIWIFLISFFLAFQEINPAWGVIFEPIPPMEHPQNNPWSQEKHDLGKKLFFDPQLSGDNSTSCASCHSPDLGWTDGRKNALGFNQQELERNTPTIINTGFYKFQFWDGRASSLEEQAKAPIQSPVEMNQNADELIEELKEKGNYKALFQKAFGNEGITLDRIAKAIAVFERSIISGTSPYDRYWSGDKGALSPQAKKGMELFFGKAKCSICHNGPFFTDNQFHDIGIRGKDLGRQKISGEKFHKAAFKTPGLRDLSLTGPYMHNGSEPNLESVINFYNTGGHNTANKSPFISPIGLNAREKNNLVEFLKSLTSDKFKIYQNKNDPE